MSVKMEKDNKTMLIVLAIVIGIVLVKNAGFFGINIQGADVYYYNKPIQVAFSITNMTSPFFQFYFNDVAFLPRDIDLSNGTYDVTFLNINTNESGNIINSAGTLKIVATSCNNNAPEGQEQIINEISVFNSSLLWEVKASTNCLQSASSPYNSDYVSLNKYTEKNGFPVYKKIKSNVTTYLWCIGRNNNYFIETLDSGLIDKYFNKYTYNCTSETRTVEVRQAYVDIEENIPNLVDKSKLWTIEIDTKNPQGDDLEADSVDIEVTDPLNAKTIIYLDKSGNKFTKQFNYENAGNYIFKIHAKKEGYVTKEVTRITSVAKPEGIHPIVYLWIGAAIIWLLLFGIKMIRRMSK